MFKTDYHVHVDWNPEKDLVEKMEEYAREAIQWGITTVGFVEHYWSRAVSRIWEMVYPYRCKKDNGTSRRVGKGKTAGRYAGVYWLRDGV